MDSDLRCNRLTCRRQLCDKAVVTTCSHIFCIDCANELFNVARLCPACETNLTEPDDVVVCSLQPTNDYKTSVLSGLTPATILEICSRAISFWQYQIHQENTFQQAVVRNVNDKNAQLQKQLENVIREANGEITILNNKKAELERDLELERRKTRELQDVSRERDKEYQKLKVQLDKLKRKALFGAGQEGSHAPQTLGQGQTFEGTRSQPRSLGVYAGNALDFTAVVGGMEASGIQRTPLVSRTTGTQQLKNWAQSVQRPVPNGSMNTSHRQQFSNFVPNADASFKSTHGSDRSGSAHEVEQMLTSQHPVRTSIPSGNGWQVANQPQGQKMFAPLINNRRPPGGFRPSIPR